MRLLLAITVGCFLAVMWVALALARRIRLAQLLQRRPARRPSSAHAEQEFFEAGEFRTPRPLRLEQEILQQRPRRALSEISFTTDRPAPLALNALETPKSSRRPEPIPIRRAAFASLFGQTVPIARIGSEFRPPVAEIPARAQDTAISSAAPASVAAGFTLHRRPPQSARPSGVRRIDLSQYNKAQYNKSQYTDEMGDLTDPYTVRASGTQGPVAADRNTR